MHCHEDLPARDDEGRYRQGSSMTIFGKFPREGYFFKYTASATLVLAMYVHVTSLFIGRDLIQQYIFTPRFDLFAGALMTYSCLAGLLSWKQVLIEKPLEKILYALIMFYFTVEIPLHIQIALAQKTDYINVLPDWFSWFMVPLIFCV
jgi:hypothetical protein